MTTTWTPMGSKIVIVDDEPAIRRLLRIALQSEGHSVVEADNAASGLAAIARQLPDLVILDLGLPDRDGQELLEELRTWSSVPVIVLSVRNRDSEKVRALDAGAQDYVTKPFSVEEFLARVRANLRDRQPAQSPVVLDDGRLAIDLSRRCVTLNEQQLELTPKEYAVLATLARSPNCVILQKNLLQEIWGPSHQGDTHYLRIVVSHLRHKLGDDPAEPRYIRTEPGVGYRLLFEDLKTG